MQRPRPGASSPTTGIIVSKVRDGDGLDTLIRMADEHRPRCEWAARPGGEREHPELAMPERAEVHLQWGTGSQAGRSFAVLHRLDYNVWDAWLHRAPGRAAAGQESRLCG